MKELLGLFLNNLLPVFLTAGAGALLGHFSEINPRTISQTILYLFSPCLIFTLLTTNNVSNSLLIQILGFTLVLVLILGGITWLIARLLRLEPKTQSSMLLATMFANSGNFGLPVVLFAFGESGLRIGSIFFVTYMVLAYTIGVLVASMGSMSFLKAIGNLLKLPLLYAVVLAVLTMSFGWEVPTPLERTINLLGDATIPCMLVLLGLQLKTVSLRGILFPIGAMSVLRLVASPLISFLLLPLFGFNPLASQTIALQSGMPTAVITTMLATEYDADPAFSSACVFITTILSPFTLTPLLYLLGA